MKISSDGQTSAGRRLVLLAASTDLVPPQFRRARVEPAEHRNLLYAAQRLRGAVYLADGAITQNDLTPDGRFASRMDLDCWHFLIVNNSGEVRGTLRYRPHLPTLHFEDLGISLSALAKDGDWGIRLRRAVEGEIRQARQRSIQYVEVGGWAMGQELRCSAESLRLALTSYALALSGGGALGIVNATHRHGSAQILRRVGGASLVWEGRELPAYYDARYRCGMEILRFDSNLLHDKLAAHVHALASTLPAMEVVVGKVALESSLGRLWEAVEQAEPGKRIAGAHGAAAGGAAHYAR